MKQERYRAALQDRPWLERSIGNLTGVHPLDVEKKTGKKWKEHVEEWALRNISEIVVRPFEELNLDQGAEFVRYRFGPPDERVSFGTGHGIRRHEAFTHTELHMFNHSTYVPSYADKFSYIWIISSVDLGAGKDSDPRTVRACIRYQRRPHPPNGSGGKAVEIPVEFDAVVRVTKVGVVGRCSSTIIDIFPFPEKFDPMSV